MTTSKDHIARHPAVSSIGGAELVAGGHTVAHALATSGHRQSYVELFEKLFSAEPAYGSLNGSLFEYLSRVEKLIVSTLDDDVEGFARLALARSASRLPTVAFFLRPQSCFERKKIAFAKRQLFSSLKLLPKLTILSITPFEIAPKYSRVTHAGLHDPQYWDLMDDRSIYAKDTDLSLAVRRAAAGRKICCVIGAQTKAKGLEFLARLLESSPFLSQNLLWVCAGHVPVSDKSLSQRLGAIGCKVVDRFLTDDEITSLYGVADITWASYAPEYDQASGIFGRSMQFGVPAIVRKGSLIDRFSAVYEIDTIALDHSALEDAARTLVSFATDRTIPQDVRLQRSQLTLSWRMQFTETVEAALRGQKPHLAK